MQSEQTNLRRQCDEICSANSAAALDVPAVRWIEKLAHDFQNLNVAERSLSNELVIAGLPITDTISPKGAVYAALKLLDGGLLERDIPTCMEDASETVFGAAEPCPFKYLC